MAMPTAPNRPLAHLPIVDKDSGLMSKPGLNVLDQMWRQVVAGFVAVPCTAAGTNVISLTPTLHREGAAVYANYEVFVAAAANTSTGAVTAFVTDGRTPLATVKVYKNNGAAQAAAGDIVAGSLYFFTYNSALNSGAGGLVAK